MTSNSGTPGNDDISVVGHPSTKRQRAEDAEDGPEPKRARTAPVEDDDVVFVEDSADGAIVIDD